MTVTIIRIRRFSDSVMDDLRRLGFVQINVVSFCYGTSMAVVHNNFGTKDSTDLIVSNADDAKILIDVFKANDMYISHHIAENPASDRFISSERGKCEIMDEQQKRRRNDERNV
jgi:hypothetical protein